MARKKEPQQRKPAASGRKGKKTSAGKSRTMASKKPRGEYLGKEPLQESDPNLFPPEMDPMTREGIETFIKELPSLLRQYTPDHWVAYRGRERIGVSESIDELYAKVRALGIADDALFYYTLTPIETRGTV
jgi:hypothetical protein